MATDFKDYYKTLGVEKTSDAKEVKKAYRKLARQYHPDVNPNNAEAAAKFREVSEAYEVLGSEEKRPIYDKYGQHYGEYENWKKAGGEATGVPFEAYINRSAASPRSGGRNRPSGYSQVSPDDFQDIFGDDSPYSEFFYSNFGDQMGGARQRTVRPMRGRDLEYPVQVTLEEAFGGVKRILQVAGEPGKPHRKLEVTIPAGVTDGGRVRLSGLGTPGRNNGPAGDLYLITQVLPHTFFERKEANLHAKLNVPLAIAILGGEVSIPTIKGGRLALKVPAYSQNSNQMRLRGQGMPVRIGADERGDLLVQLQVILPTELNDTQREALENFAQLLQEGESEGNTQ